MLERIEIENFQSHKKTDLKFVPGVNVIIGSSDSGKSAILRAINWVASNRPLGDSFRSEWGGDTKVKIQTSDKQEIERNRSASKNEYILNKDVLKAFGTDVPEEVINALKMDSYNIQSQMDSPFLLSHTPGEAARMLNKAASIDDIDIAISGISGSLTRINNNIKYKEKQLAEYKDKIKQYENLSNIEELVSAAEALEKQKEILIQHKRELSLVYSKVDRVQQGLKESEHIPELLEDVLAVEKEFNTYQEQLTENELICKISQRIKNIHNLLKKTENVEKAINTVNEIITQDKELKEKQNQIYALEKITNRIIRNQSAIDKMDKEIKHMEEIYKNNMPDTCPLCESQISREGRRNEKNQKDK